MILSRTTMFLAATIAGCAVAQAQSNLSVPPRFDDPGCGGILCHPRDPSAPDPRDPAVAAATAAAYGPPCGGILCDLDPKGMRPPVTAAEAEAQARARAEAAAPPVTAPEPSKPLRKSRHRQAKTRAKATRRTADAAAAN